MLTERILVNEEDIDMATAILDNDGIMYDLDSGDRIMCDADDVNYIIGLLDDYGIDADLI